ncbi:hypothetical protein Chor_017135, partial [Crotalus horridus]
VFWDLYCAAPDRRETCEHSSEAKAFHDYSSAATTSPVMANLPPSDAIPSGPMLSGFFQGPPGSQPSLHAQAPLHNPNAAMIGPHNQPFMPSRFPGGLRPSVRMPSQPSMGVSGQPLMPSAMDPAIRSQVGHPNMGPMQRMTPPRGMTGMAPQNYGGGIRPPPGSLVCPGMPTMNIFVHFSLQRSGCSRILAKYKHKLDSTNSSENMYMMNSVGPPPSRPGFSMGPSPEGPMAGMSAMEPHHMNGSLGKGLHHGVLFQRNSPGSMASIANPPGTPRDDSSSEMGSSFINPFQSESYSPSMTMSV